MAFLSDNRVVFELHLQFFPDELHKANLLYLKEKLKKSFIHYLPENIIFQAVLSQYEFMTRNTVKFQMRTPIMFPQAIEKLQYLYKVIKQYSCFFPNNTLEVMGHIDTIRYDTLKNQLKQQEELEFKSIEELVIFLRALLHEANKEKKMLPEEKIFYFQELPDPLDADLHVGGDTVNDEKKMLPKEKIFYFQELLDPLDADLHIGGDTVNDEEIDAVNDEKKMLPEEKIFYFQELPDPLDADLHVGGDTVNDEEIDAVNDEEIDAVNDEEIDAVNVEEIDAVNGEEIDAVNDEEIDAVNGEEQLQLEEELMRILEEFLNAGLHEEEYEDEMIQFNSESGTRGI